MSLSLRRASARRSAASGSLTGICAALAPLRPLALFAPWQCEMWRRVGNSHAVLSQTLRAGGSARSRHGARSLKLSGSFLAFKPIRGSRAFDFASAKPRN